MSSVLFELRAVSTALQTYLTTQGWTGITYKEGYRSGDTIVVPTVAFKYLPSTKTALQVGGSSEKLIKRNIQVTAYMESESRADQIVEHIMDFIELTTVIISDVTPTTVGTLICQDTNSIYGETLPPIMTTPEVLRWRGIVRAILEAHYF